MARSTPWRRKLLRRYLDRHYSKIGCLMVVNGFVSNVILDRARKAWRLWSWMEFNAQYRGEQR